MSPSPALPLVVLLSGFWPHATAEAARDLSAADPRWNLLLYTSGRPGELIRTDASGVARDDRAGPDLPAALVRDLLTVAGPGRPDLLVLLPESCEPDQLRAAWAAHDGPHHAHLGTLITVVDAGLLLDGLSGEESLRSVGLHQRAADERGIGDVVARQIEQADAVVVTGRPGDDPWEAEQLRVLLRRIAPWSLHLHLDDARLPGVARRPARHLAPLTPPTRGLAGRAVGLHEPLPDHGVVSCVFRARRPFHPARLHHALADLTDQVLRARGHFWLASRPDLVMSWESAGDRTFSPAGVWLDGRPDESWAEADEQRRVAAALDWDVYYGDRHHHLVFIGLDIDPVRIHRVLAACLLTDDELSRGENFWRRLPDPFAPAYAFPA
ncbi:MAG: GTP-binding protein [Actinoplanes sp.]